jgi:hypothetical protein
MPGGGMYGFVTYGSQNVLLSANPDMTYFYKVFRKYTHYAEESFSIPFDGPNQLKWDQSLQIRAKLPRYTDLVRDMYFVFTLPDIYSKYVESRQPHQYNFSWAEYIGCHIIQSAGIYIGGQKIQEIDGTYIVSKSNLDMTNTEFEKFKELVGQVPEMYEPANGQYSGGLSSSSVQGSYPTVYRNPTVTSQLNRPSIMGRDIYVPLPFWFSQDPSLSLPLCALQLQEVELQIVLRPIRDLYTINDPSGYPVAPGYRMNASASAYQNNVPTYIPEPTFNMDTNNYFINNFLTDIDTPLPPKNELPYNPRLYCTYVYLTDEERTVFSTNELKYLIYQTNWYNFPAEFKRNFLQLEIHNPITRLLIVPRRSDSIPYRNAPYNYTNWVNPRRPPFVATPGLVPPASTYATSGLLVAQGQKEIVRELRVICDGNEIQDARPGGYFSRVVAYKYYEGGNEVQTVPYPFSLKYSPIQPSGSINASRIKTFEVDLYPYQLPTNTPYVYDVTIYVESINWVVIASGSGGLKYAV